jgi:uncharacterized phiE125 gp8 family phage protein
MYSSSACTFANVPSYLDGMQSAPALEPVGPDEIGDHSRIDGVDESLGLMGYIAAARAWVENEVRLSLGERTLTLYLDCFPDDGPIELRFPPINSVTSVGYVDSTGATQTLSSSLYRTDLVRRPGRIEPAYGQVWPFTYPVSNAITVTFSAGYTSPQLVPESAKQAVRYMAALMYQKREPTKEDIVIVQRILDPLRWDGSF